MKLVTFACYFLFKHLPFTYTNIFLLRIYYKIDMTLFKKIYKILLAMLYHYIFNKDMFGGA